MTLSISHKRSYQANEPQETSNKVSRQRMCLKRHALIQENPTQKRVKICRKRVYECMQAAPSRRSKRPRFFAPKPKTDPAILKNIFNLPPKSSALTRHQPLPGNENIPKPQSKRPVKKATPAPDLDDITAKIAHLRINFR